MKKKIFKDGKNQEKISEYFDHLLSYNLNRKENIININEFEKVLKYENFNLSSQDILILFNYIDISHKGYIDRLQFINAIKIIPFPITIIQKYLKLNKLSILDIAFKMEIDLYNNPLDFILNKHFNHTIFFSKMKSLNKEFDKNLITNLYIALSGNINNKLSYKKMFEIYNVYNISNYTYLNIYENKEKINEKYINIICNNIPFIELKEKLFLFDSKAIGKLNYNDFFNIINNILNGKIEKQNFIHFLRINKLIEINNEIDSIIFLRFIDSKYPDNSFTKCLTQLADFLDKECDRDIFLFTIKLNNLNNNSSTNEIINPEKLYYIFKEKNEYLKFETIKKFDYDEDGIITMNDIKNTIIKYYDNQFFNNEKAIKDNKKKEEDKKIQNKITNLFIYLNELLKKNNLTYNNFFLYLDKNKDEIIDKDEFINQILSLKYFDNKIYNKEEIEIFFQFLDEYKNNKVDINIFQNKLRFLQDELNKKNKDNILDEKKIDFILEDLILNEFCNWYKKNKDIYTEEEIFSTMDKDNDGIISKDDLKNFINNIFFISKNELFDLKISNLIHIISLNKENNNISLVDLHHLIDCINKGDLKKYKEDILVNYIKGKNNKIWIKYIIKELKIQINQKYGNNIEKMYNEYNIHFYQNKGLGLSFDNFELFIFKNLGFFENYHLDKKELLLLFNYISNNKKFINLNDLKIHFYNYNNNLIDNNINDFYEIMHKIIKKFLNENFPLCEEAFQFFQNIKNKNKINDYITIKEFFNGINNLFPKKYDTQTILNYIQKFFKKSNLNELNLINYNEFKEIYYKNIISSTINNLQKSYNEPFSTNINKKNIMSYSVDNKNKKNQEQ